MSFRGTLTVVTILALAAAVLYGTADFLGGVASRRASVFAVLATTVPAGAAARALGGAARGAPRRGRPPGPGRGRPAPAPAGGGGRALAGGDLADGGNPGRRGPGGGHEDPPVAARWRRHGRDRARLRGGRRGRQRLLRARHPGRPVRARGRDHIVVPGHDGAAGAVGTRRADALAAEGSLAAGRGRGRAADYLSEHALVGAILLVLEDQPAHLE